MAKDDVFDSFEDAIRGSTDIGNPWQLTPTGRRYEPDYELLQTLLAIPIEAGSGSESGRLANAIDIAQWSRGPELMVSTKSMVSSFGNNLKNRFEESYGDAKNLRARFPLAAIGFLFVFRSTILAKPGRFESAIDMLRKLRSEMDVYDTTGMVVAEWDDEALSGGWASGPFGGVTIRNDVTPPDLQADQFLAVMIEAVLDRTPVEAHVEVRERHEHRALPVTELDEEDDDLDDSGD